jgi:hypothetical protein
MTNALVYIGSAALMAWGIAHILALRPVVAGFGDLSTDNRRIITMEWIVEGIAMCFVASMASAVTATADDDDPIAVLVIRGCAGLLFILSALSAMTGARTAAVPMRVCPLVKTAVALTYVVATFV